MTTSCVADENAVSSAKAPRTVRPCVGPTIAMPMSPAATRICVSSIQPRRRPSRPRIGASTRSTIGDQNTLSEYARPTHEMNPMSVSDVPTSRSQKPSVLPVSRKGRPEAKPSASITRTRGCVYALRTTSFTQPPRV